MTNVQEQCPYCHQNKDDGYLAEKGLNDEREVRL